MRRRWTYVIWVVLVPAFWLPQWRYLLFLMVPLGVLAFEWRREGKPGRIFLLRILSISLGLRVICALLIQLQPWGELRPFFFIDAQSYHRWGEQIAGFWHRGEFPPLWKDIYIGTLHTGYFKLLGGLYYVCGSWWGLGIALNILFSVLLVMVMYVLAREFFGERAARWAAVVVALYPSLWFWSAFVLKDIILTFYFCFALYVGYRAVRDKGHLYLLGFAVASWFLFLLRVYSLLTLWGTFFLYIVLFDRRRWWLLGASAMAFISYAVMRSHIVLGDIYIFKEIEEQMLYSFLNLLPDAYWSRVQVYQEMLASIPRFLLAPYAWYFAPRFDIHYFLYPGQWVLYLVVIPLSIKGAYYLFRERKNEGFLLLFPLFVNWYLFFLVYKGAVPRQRLSLELLMIVMAALGIQRPALRTLPVYYGLLGLFIVLHLIKVYVFGVY